MSEQTNTAGRIAVRRVCWGAGMERAAQAIEPFGVLEFMLGDEVRSLRPVKNDGIYPHKDIGEVLVQRGDAGIVRERWSFLGEIYYTVEFESRAAVVIMRGREMIRPVAP